MRVEDKSKGATKLTSHTEPDLPDVSTEPHLTEFGLQKPSSSDTHSQESDCEGSQ